MSLGFPGLPTTASAEGDGEDLMQSIMLSMESPGVKKPALEQAQEPEQSLSAVPKNVLIRDNTPAKEDPSMRRDVSTSSSTADSLTRYSANGKIKRVHSSAGEKMYIFPPKNSEVREIFSLPEEENLLEDFNCALQKKILLQGRLYLFDNYVCFYANVFGYIKRKVIPLKDVTGVRKAKTAIVVPNAVEITVFGKREFFTSFLSPDKAYRMILEAWKNTSRYAKLFLGKPLSEGETEEPSRPLSAPIRRRSRSKKDLMDSSWDADDSPKSSDQAYDPHTLAPDASPTPGSPPSESAHRNSSDTAGSPPRAGTSTGRNSLDTSRAPRSGKDTPADQLSLQDLEEGTSVLQSRIPDLQVFVETELNVTTLEFFSIFWKDSSTFFKEFLESSGNDCKSVNILPWTDHRHVGHARDVTFEAPVKASFGPKSTHCHQTQAYRLSASGNHLIIETSQVMSDIPYSDYFRVEMRWEVRNAKAGNKCNLTVAMDVPFSKKTVWKSLIEASARDECHKQYHGWVARAQDEIKEYRAKTPLPSDASMHPVALTPPTTALPDTSVQELPDVISNMLRSQSELKKQESFSAVSSNPKRPATMGSFAVPADETPAKNTASSRSNSLPQHGNFMLRTPGWSMLARNAVLCLLAVGCAGLVWWIWNLWSLSEGLSLHPSALPRGWKPGALCLEGECSAKFWERRISYLTQDLGMLERRISLIHEELAMAQQNIQELQERENYNNEGCRNFEEGSI